MLPKAAIHKSWPPDSRRTTPSISNLPANSAMTGPLFLVLPDFISARTRSDFRRGPMRSSSKGLP